MVSIWLQVGVEQGIIEDDQDVLIDVLTSRKIACAGPLSSVWRHTAPAPAPWRRGTAGCSLLSTHRDPMMRINSSMGNERMRVD